MITRTKAVPRVRKPKAGEEGLENLIPPMQFPKDAKRAAKPIERAKTALVRELTGVEGDNPHAEKARKMLTKALEALG